VHAALLCGRNGEPPDDDELPMLYAQECSHLWTPEHVAPRMLNSLFKRDDAREDGRTKSFQFLCVWHAVVTCSAVAPPFAPHCLPSLRPTLPPSLPLILSHCALTLSLPAVSLSCVTAPSLPACVAVARSLFLLLLPCL
jgi:hypothetical protein